MNPNCCAWKIWIAACLLVGCSGVKGNEGLPVLELDSTADSVLSDLAPSDTTLADLPGVSDTVMPGEVSACTDPGCACGNDSACTSGNCIETAGGLVCAAPCGDGCPAGFACGGAGKGHVCLPSFPRLCEPCTKDSDCLAGPNGTGACVPYTDGSVQLGAFCGGGKCDTATPCPSGYTCASVATLGGLGSQQCVRDDKQCACDARAVAEGLSTTCNSVASVGACPGKRTCSAVGLSACTAPVASAEVCDGIDNNCDGKTDDVSCDDQNPCTTDACDAALKACTHTPNTVPCDDGSKCTSADACAGGSCTGKAKNCDDGNDCTDDGCDPKTGCTASEATGPCGADGPCTTPGQCSGGACSGAKPKNCSDGNACTIDSCTAADGSCQHKATSSGCDDGDPCTSGDNCGSGVCAGMAKNCDDNNPCTDDGCGPAGCSNSATVGACDDANPCTVNDTCTNGVCGGKAKTCNDSNPCTNDSCDQVKGCISILVVGAGCEDGNPCTAGDACDGAGACLAGKAVNCDDSNPCTADNCDAVTGACKNAPIGGNCDDGIACTTGDLCAAGLCSGKAKVCGDSNPCTADQCDNVKGCVFSVVPGAGCEDGSLCTVGDKCDQSGSCLAGSPLGCDDKNACTADVCDVTTGACKNTPIGSACDDGNACTNKDFCQGGVCAGQPVVCDDNNPCTSDSCDTAKGCQTLNLSGSCSDGNPCTVGEACASGVCTGGAAAGCDDANPCTTDACDPKSGCTHNGNNLTCDDQNPCTVGDKCDALSGQCVSGGNQCSCQTQADCDAQPNSNPCLGKLVCVKTSLPYKCAPDVATKVLCSTSGDTACSLTSCDPADGKCKASNINESGPCSDSNACTNGDVCTAGKCVPGPAQDCDDKNGCTNDSCDPGSGCKHVNNTSVCDDGDACTQNDACTGGACKGQAVVNCCVAGDSCSDNNPCTVDACDVKAGKCTHDAPAADGLACDADGSGCTQNDLCVAGTCTAGAAPDCAGMSDTCNSGGCKSTGINTFSCIKNPKQDGISCDDGLYCNTGETCKAGACQGGAQLNCSSSGCTSGTCDEGQKKCVGSPKPDGTACDADNNGCTITDKCVAGACVAGSPYQCSQPVGDPCNNWVCNSTGPQSYQCGPTPKDSGTTCDDGKFCTTTDTCDGTGKCAPGPVLDCSAQSSNCATGTCDETQKKCLAVGKSDGTACNDSDSCTATDTCKAGMCVGSNNVCGDFKLSTFKTLASGLGQSSLADMGQGRFRSAWAHSTTALSARSYRADWSREWTEANVANTSAASSAQEYLVGGGPLVVPSTGGGHDVYWMSEGWANSTYYMYKYGTLNACGTIGTSGDVAYASNSSSSGGCAYYWGSSGCQVVTRSYAGRHLSFQHFDGLDAPSGGVVDVYALNTGCVSNNSQGVQLTAFAVAPYSDGRRFVAWTQSGTNYKRIINANGSMNKDLGSDTAMKNYDVAVYGGDGSSILVWDDGAEIWGQLYYSNGNTNGTKFQVNTTTAGVQSMPRVAYEPVTGLFIVAWNTDTNAGDVTAQVFFSDGAKAGSEIAVNTTSTGFQGNARVATHADGSFVIAYEDGSAKDGAGFGILGQWFTSDGGTKVGGEKVINATTAGDQKAIRAIGLSTGDVVISWSNLADGHVYARKFDATGGALNGATEFIANTTKVDEQQDPAVAVAGDNSFVVSWDSNLQDGSGQGVYFQRYSAAGVPTGIETQANTTTNLAQITPSLGADQAGNFAIIWDSYTQDGSMNGIFGQRFAAAGTKVGTEFGLNQYTTFDQRRPALAMLPSGKFAAVWESNGQPLGAAYDVVMRCYDDNGTALANEAIVNTTTADKQQYAHIAAFPDGSQKYVVTWQSYAEDTADSWGVYAQLYTFDCKAIGSAFAVNTFKTGDQTWPRASVDPKGNFVIAWSSLGQDGDNQGIYAQAYDNTGAKIGGEQKLNAVTVNEQSHAAVTLLPSGKLVGAWQTLGEDEAGWALKAGMYAVNAGIGAVGLDWLANTTFTGDQSQPAIAARADGTWVTVWRSAAQDGDKGAVIGRVQGVQN